jgi:glutamyl-tRNA reductase
MKTPSNAFARGIDSLLCISLSSRRGNSAHEREQSNLPVDTQLRRSILSSWIQELRGDHGAEASLVYLATCHRIEFYAFGVPSESLLSLWTELCGPSVLKAEIHKGLAAFEHLLRVNSSLASEVLGETQITGQVKKAFEEARENGWLSSPLARSFDEVLRITKRIRAETKIGTGTISVAHVAVDGLRDVFEELGTKSALIVGAGSMAEQALQRLLKFGVGHITWINRSQDKLFERALASYCSIRDFAELPTLAWEHSIIVLATSAEAPILRLDNALPAKKKAEHLCCGPRIILDLGLPRNADERLHGYEDFWVRNVDEFRDLAEKSTQQRRDSLWVAEGILKEELSNFTRLWNHWEQGALVANLYQYTKNILDRELAKLNVEEKPEIEYLVRNVYAKTMHQLLEQLRSLEETEAKLALETLNLAWRQSETSWQKQTLEQDPKQQQTPPSLKPSRQLASPLLKKQRVPGFKGSPT